MLIYTVLKHCFDRILLNSRDIWLRHFVEQQQHFTWFLHTKQQSSNKTQNQNQSQTKSSALRLKQTMESFEFTFLIFMFTWNVSKQK